jgi:hypothetical protein
MTVQAEIADAINGFLATVFGNPMVQAGLEATAWALIVVWLLATYWVFRDALARTRNPIVVVGAATGVALALLIWRILRPTQTLDEAHEQALTAMALEAAASGPTCPGCAAAASPEWRRCPWCRTWMLDDCPRCERLVEVDASICPWCALDLTPGMLMPGLAAPGLVPVPAPATAPAPALKPAPAPALMPVTDPAPAPGIPVMDPGVESPTRAARGKRARGAGGRGAGARGSAETGARVSAGATGTGPASEAATRLWAPVPGFGPEPGEAATATLVAALSRGRDMIRRAAAPAVWRPEPEGDEADGEAQREDAPRSSALW